MSKGERRKIEKDEKEALAEKRGGTDSASSCCADAPAHT